MKFKFTATGKGQAPAMFLGDIPLAVEDEKEFSKAEAEGMRLFERGGFEPLDKSAKDWCKACAAACQADGRPEVAAEFEASMERAKAARAARVSTPNTPAADAGNGGE